MYIVLPFDDCLDCAHIKFPPFMCMLWHGVSEKSTVKRRNDKWRHITGPLLSISVIPGFVCLQEKTRDQRMVSA